MSFWASFWLTNIHFAIELFGALTALIITYVLFITWRSHKKKRIFLRLLGFALLAVFFVLHSGGNSSELINAIQPIIKFIALLLIGISFYIDPVQSVPAKPSAPALLILGTASVFVSQLLDLVSIVLVGLIALRIYIKFSEGLEKELKNLLFAFGILLLSEIAGFLMIFADSSYVALAKLASDFGIFWFAAHIFKVFALIFFAIWAWGYLRFKLVTQVVGTFVAGALLIFIIITFVYTSLLVSRMQQSTLENLKINLQTFSYAIDRLKDESLATSSLIASSEPLRDALAQRDSERLSALVQEQMISSGVDFLAVVDNRGIVLARGEDPGAVSDILSENVVVKAALEGRKEVNMMTKEWVNAPQVLIEASSPVATSGAIYTGHIVDNAFVDGVKEATGLDVTIFAQDTRSATTLTGPDGVSRLVGVKETNEDVKKTTLTNGELYLGLSKVFQREYLAAYSPLKDVDGNILGMLFVGYPSVALFEAAQSSLNSTFYVTAILAVLSFIPAYFLGRFIEEHQV